MEQAIADAGLDQSLVSNERTGLVAGSGGPSTSSMFAAHQVVLKAGSPKRIGPLAGSKMHVLNHFGEPIDRIQD
jgi:3-oxoacyl-[acyl-carrier-protein] synthase-1